MFLSFQIASLALNMSHGQGQEEVEGQGQNKTKHLQQGNLTSSQRLSVHRTADASNVRNGPQSSSRFRFLPAQDAQTETQSELKASPVEFRIVRGRIHTRRSEVREGRCRCKNGRRGPTVSLFHFKVTSLRSCMCAMGNDSSHLQSMLI